MAKNSIITWYITFSRILVLQASLRTGRLSVGGTAAGAEVFAWFAGRFSNGCRVLALGPYSSSLSYPDFLEFVEMVRRVVAKNNPRACNQHKETKHFSTNIISCMYVWSQSLVRPGWVPKDTAEAMWHLPYSTPGILQLKRGRLVGILLTLDTFIQNLLRVTIQQRECTLLENDETSCTFGIWQSSKDKITWYQQNSHHASPHLQYHNC